MSRVCQVTGKRPMAGNNVSHAKNRTRRRFEPNLHTHRFWVESENRFIKIRLSTKGLRIIDKNGIDQVLAGMRARGVKYREQHNGKISERKDSASIERRNGSFLYHRQK